MMRRSVCVLLLGTAIMACGGDDKGASTSSGGSSSSSSSSSSSGGGDDAGTTSSSGASGTTAPKSLPAPAIDRIMKMTGGLHLVWNLPADVTCDKIEGERKSATEAYKVVWTTPGTVDNKHDGTATANTTYTYRLRCKVGADYSEYSNEMSKNPQQ